jgi:hypothetical protein
MRFSPIFQTLGTGLIVFLVHAADRTKRLEESRELKAANRETK